MMIPKIMKIVFMKSNNIFQKNILLKNITALLIIIVFFTSCNRDKVLLQYNLDKGKTYKIKFISESSSIQEMFGTKNEIKSKNYLDMSFKVIDKNISDSSITMNLFYNSFRFALKSNTMDMDFDSEKPSNDTLMSNIYKSLVGLNFNFKVALNGDIKDVSGLNDAFKSVFSKFEKDSAVLSKLDEGVLKNLSQSLFKSNANYFMGTYNKIPVNVGESWTNTTYTESVFPMICENTYTLIYRNNGIVIINIKSKIKSEDKPNFAVKDDVNMKFDMKGIQTGELRINEKTGWIINGNFKQNISGSMTLSAPQQASVNYTIPYSLENNITLTGE